MTAQLLEHEGKRLVREAGLRVPDGALARTAEEAAGLSAAYAGSTPLVCVTGQVPSEFLHAGLGHLHEMPDQLATLRTLTKWAERIDGPADAPALVAEALRQARSGRPLPVALEMAWDVFDQRADVAFPAPPEPEPAAPAEQGALERAAELLAGARNPMLMVGSGAFDAAAEVLELAERLQAPVVSYRSGRGIVPGDHHLGFTCAEGFERWPETDVLVGIGSRLELLWYRWPDRPGNLEIIDINLDPEHAGRTGAAVGLVGDAAATTAALTRLLAGTRRPSRRAEFEALKAAKHDEIQRAAPHAGHLAAIRKVLPRDGFFVDEMCQAGFASCYAFPVYRPRTFVSFGAFGALGQGYPTALGVKAAHPDRPVVSISGDGGFQFALQELATAMQYGLDVVAIVFNNQAYGNVLRDQEQSYGGRVLGAQLAIRISSLWRAATTCAPNGPARRPSSPTPSIGRSNAASRRSSRCPSILAGKPRPGPSSSRPHAEGKRLSAGTADRRRPPWPWAPRRP